ncbi:MAG: futalosine hydrolase [Gaiellales bacterium]|jgi:futalosine hydrolase|nr:futalosine hydrolase [Gaiellales bacterium]
MPALSTLILVPTELEAELLAWSEAPVSVCGFGLAAAGAGAAHAIAQHRPQRVLLVGLAGSYDLTRMPIGTAMMASAVRCHGIGAGGQSAAELGWTATDQIELDGRDGLALSVAEASATPEQAAERHRKHPPALIEEMEGYAVAVAATLFEVPLTVVRGVSNAAGDRDRARWQTGPAMSAARSVLAMLAR